MRLIFAGTPFFAREALDALLKAGHEITLVLTQPDRPAGRGMKLQPSAVKQLALEHRLCMAQPTSLRLDGQFSEEAKQAQTLIASMKADAMVVVAYGLLLPQWVLDLPRYGCFNIHASLLPRWRGAAPIQRAIEAGDTQTGITIMQMDVGLDTGDMIAIASTPIHACDTTQTLHDRLSTLGAALMVQTLEKLENETQNPLMHTKQTTHGITYAQKINKSEGAINWCEPAEVIARRIRAFNPAPGAHTMLSGKSIKIWMAHPCESFPTTKQNTYGEILKVEETGIRIACGDNRVLTLTEIQCAGAKRLPLANCLNGLKINVGMRFDEALG